jgi:hypothetical protein
MNLFIVLNVLYLLQMVRTVGEFGDGKVERTGKVMDQIRVLAVKAREMSHRSNNSLSANRIKGRPKIEDRNADRTALTIQDTI